MQKVLQAVGFFDGQWNVTVLMPTEYEVTDGVTLILKDAELQTFVADGNAETPPDEYKGCKLEYVRKHFRDDETTKAANATLSDQLAAAHRTIATLNAERIAPPAKAIEDLTPTTGA